MDYNYDVIIIGAGPAGSVAGARLIQDNLSVLILEKTVFPRFVIGESLLPQCMDYLEKVDLLKCVEALKFQIKTGVSFYQNEERCDFLFSEKFNQGWDYTYQVKRADFDLALITETEKKGAEVVFNAEVTDVKTSPNVQLVKYTDGEGISIELKTRYVIDASGYGRVLPRLFNIEKQAASTPRGAIFSHIQDPNRVRKAADNIFVHAFNNNTAWIWSIPFSDGTASVGVVGEAAFIESCSENAGQKFRDLVQTFPGLEGRFETSKLLFEPKKILNYSISVERMQGEGYVLCGNSTEFLDPIFSSGVMLAVTSGYQAADLVCKQLKGEKVNWEEDYVKEIKHGVDVFRSYVDAWYSGELHKIFFFENGNPEFKRQICSVLAGYVWETSNPFVKKHKTVLSTLAKVIDLN